MSKRFQMDERERETITRLYPALKRFAAVTGSVDMEPDDLVQDALVRTLSRHNLADLDDPLAYLRRVIANLASNERRSAARRRRAIARLAIDEGSVPSYPADVEALLDLPPRERAILFLVEVEGMPYAEAAQHLGISTVSARQLASRARRRARFDWEVANG